MPDAPALHLRKCGSCGVVEPAARNFCSKCGSAHLEPANVEGRGVLTSWTVVRRPALAFKHLGIIPIVMVTLRDGTVVTGRFEGDSDALRVGSEVILAHEADGVPHFRNVA